LATALSNLPPYIGPSLSPRKKRTNSKLTKTYSPNSKEKTAKIFEATSTEEKTREEKSPLKETSLDHKPRIKVISAPAEKRRTLKREITKLPPKRKIQRARTDERDMVEKRTTVRERADTFEDCAIPRWLKLDNVEGIVLSEDYASPPMANTSRDVSKKIESEEGYWSSEEEMMMSSSDQEETIRQKDPEVTASVLEEILVHMSLADENVKNDSQNHEMDKILFLN